jgi:hypothetical protein
MDADRQSVLSHSKATQQRIGLETKQNSFWLFLVSFLRSLRNLRALCVQKFPAPSPEQNSIPPQNPAVLYRLCNVRHLHAARTGQIGYRAGHLQSPVR